MTPRTQSESGPNHGLSSVRTSFGNVFASDENDAEDEDQLLANEEGESDKRSEEISSDSGLVESEGNCEENKVEIEKLLPKNGSEKATPQFRARKESYV